MIKINRFSVAEVGFESASVALVALQDGDAPFQLYDDLHCEIESLGPIDSKEKRDQANSIALIATERNLGLLGKSVGVGGHVVSIGHRSVPVMEMVKSELTFIADIGEHIDDNRMRESAVVLAHLSLSGFGRSRFASAKKTHLGDKYSHQAESWTHIGYVSPAVFSFFLVEGTQDIPPHVHQFDTLSRIRQFTGYAFTDIV